MACPHQPVNWSVHQIASVAIDVSQMVGRRGPRWHLWDRLLTGDQGCKPPYGVRPSQACRLFFSAEPDQRPSSMEKGSALHNTRMADHASDSEEPQVCSTSRAGSFKEIHPVAKAEKGLDLKRSKRKFPPRYSCDASHATRGLPSSEKTSLQRRANDPTTL